MNDRKYLQKYKKVRLKYKVSKNFQIIANAFNTIFDYAKKLIEGKCNKKIQ